jgi:transcriptional regulator with XRE-family HTH domain
MTGDRPRSRIRERREALGLTRHAIFLETGISENTLKRWELATENGRSPRLKPLLRLANLLECPLEDIIEDWWRPAPDEDDAVT